MGYQEEMVEMEPKETKERRETLVCRGHLDHEVHKLTECHYTCWK